MSHSTGYDAPQPTGDAMKRRSRAGGEPIKARRRKAPKPKRRNAPKAVPSFRPYLQRCRGRSAHPRTERGVGAADGDLGGACRLSAALPAIFSRCLQAMLENAVRICDAKFGISTAGTATLLHVAGDAQYAACLRRGRKRSPIVPVRKLYWAHDCDKNGGSRRRYCGRARPTLNTRSRTVAPSNLAAYGRFWPCRCSRRTN